LVSFYSGFGLTEIVLARTIYFAQCPIAQFHLMKKILSLALFCACSYGALANPFPIFDPFVDATASNGTSYADGTLLRGQTNSAGNGWAGINTAQTSVIVLTGYAFSNYSVGSPLSAPAGGEVGDLNGKALGQGVRMDILPAISNGTVYASMFVKVTDISALATSTGTGALQGGIFHIAFGNTNGTSTANNGSLGGRWYFKKSATDSTKFNIGIAKVTSPTGGSSNPTAYYDSRDFSVNDELFVVAGYTFNNAATNDDVVKLWVNPSAATLGQSTEPTPPVQGGTTPADSDLGFISCFNIMARNITQVSEMYFDEVRIGTNWAQVTSTNTVSQPIVQPKLTASLVDPTTVQLSWGTNSTGFTLQSTATLLSSGTSWGTVAGSATVSGTNYLQTDAVSGTKFYRLMHP
jgi:hypothetical protein